MTNSTILPRLAPRDRTIANLSRFLSALPQDKAWRVEVSEHKARRTLSQNALLWALYSQIIEKGGEAMAGWEKEDLHDFFLIGHFGGEPRTLFGRKRIKPLRRSSNLNKQEFSDFVDYIARFMAGQGVYLDMPEGIDGH